MLCALKSAQNAESSLDSAKDAYQEAQKIMQERMLKNLAFFARNKIAKSLQTTLNGGNKRFNLYFTQSEINIIDLANNRFLYPKGAFLSVSQNLAQTPLNNDKWRIYSNNLRLGKIENRANSATIEAMNKIAEIGLNSSLGMQFRTCEKFWESTDSGLVLSQNFSQIQKPHRKYFDFDSQSESPAKQTKIAETSPDSTNPQNLGQKSYHSKSFSCHSERSEESKNNPSLRANPKDLRGNPLCDFYVDSATRTQLISFDSFAKRAAPPTPLPLRAKKLRFFAFRGRASLFPLLAKNRRLHFCNLESDFLHHEAGEIKGASHRFDLDSANSQNLNQNNLSLRADSQNLQGRLPRSHSFARNDENLDSSLRKCFAQNDNLSKFAESTPDSADSQNNLTKNNSSLRANSQNLDKNKSARSANPYKSFCYFWLKPKVESPLPLNPNLPNSARISELQSPQDEFAPTYHLPPLFLPQTNIFGLCGGLFLDILVENGYFFHSLLIYEEDSELFALSCYFVDYERLFSRTSPKSCYIFIENLLDKGLLNHYFYSKKITNNFLRLELSLLKSPKTRDFKALTFETYKANARGWGSFEDEMVGLKNTFANAQNAPFLRITSKLKTPICVVGSGPSLESNIDFIRANQSKMLIFSCGTALKVLRKHKIAIDFQIEIERVPYLAEVLQNSNLGDTAILCASLVNPKVLEIAKSTILFMRGGSAASYIFDDAGGKIAPLEFCAPFVGNAGFSLACALSDEVIICGMDCGFIKGFAKHASGSIYGDESAEIPRDCFKVEGNCADFEVFSNAIFSLSKESFAQSIAHYKPKIVHNLSLGAKIKGANFTQNLSLKNRAQKMPLNSLITEKTALDSAKKTLKDSALNFIDELKNAINCDDSKPIATKQELFCYIDSITDFLAKISEKNPKIGILFEGSISHLLQSAMIALLSVKKNAIGAEFEACKAVILGVCEAFRREIGKLQ